MYRPYKPKKYIWPSSAITEQEMLMLYQKRKETKKPINQLIKEAVITYCRKDNNHAV